MKKSKLSKEALRLEDHYQKNKNWLKWGPYLSERQWGTVREDYSEHGTAWDYFPHDHARSRVYRWGEDGLAGISDDLQRMCFAVALWNGKDPILKERLFGLTGPEGNHGEDVKELYYYLDNTPTHSYMKQLYKYPQEAYPYEDLVWTNRNRAKQEQEYELLDTGLFDHGRYFDVFTEYAKKSEEDILIRITIHNRAEESAFISLLPTLWFRNLWSFGLMQSKPTIQTEAQNANWGSVRATHDHLGDYHFYFQKPATLLFTENESNTEKLYGIPNQSPFVKDAFHKAIIHQDFESLEAQNEGTKFSPLYQANIEAHGHIEIRLRLSKDKKKTNPLGAEFEATFRDRQSEADEFYDGFISPKASNDLNNVQRQAFAGMLWSKQYYNIDVPQWLNGDSNQPAPPEARKNGRNSDWMTLNNEDIISMPDKWEYPWYAAWDLAFHCVPLATIDPNFAKNQLILFLREWYMRPNGQIPAYEWAFGDVNPPVHAWSCMEVYRIEKQQAGKGDIDFLKRAFQKLLINFTWWVNRKDRKDNNIFEGGFLGLDNIGVFDRSAAIPGGGHLEQADGTSWMAMYCLNMLDMALEIALFDPTYEDVATKFFEHFIIISESLNRIGDGWTGAWDEEEGFFYDILALPNDQYIPLKVRSLVGLSTLFATLVIDQKRLDKLPDFYSRLKWYRNYRQKNKHYQVVEQVEEGNDILLSLTPKYRLERILKALLDEKEFFSAAGIRSISKIHQTPYMVHIDGQEYGLQYEPAESSNGLFGGNSNWRGPIWMPMNYLLIQALKTYHAYYQNSLKVECPTGSGTQHHLGEVVNNLTSRLVSIFTPDANGKRPVHGHEELYQKDPHFKDLVLFYEYFHGDSGRGVGASHQTGWTGLVATLSNQIHHS